VFAVNKKVCIQLSYMPTRFIERFVHWVNVWNSGSVVKVIGCESGNYVFESRWNKKNWHVYLLNKRCQILFFFKCVAKVATIFSLDRNKTLDFRFDVLIFCLMRRSANYMQCKLYADEHSSIITLYENKYLEHVLRL